MQANLSQAVRSGQRGDFDFQPELRKWCSIKAYTVPYTVHSTQYTVHSTAKFDIKFDFHNLSNFDDPERGEK